MGTFKPNLETKQSIDNLRQVLLDELPTQLGIDEIIPGCEVINADTYGVGIAVIPRYITVALGGNEYVPVMYRGSITVTVGAFVTVIHYRNGNLYDVLGAGGATGFITVLAHVPTHGDGGGVGGTDPFIEIGAVEPVVTFPGKLWVDTS